MYEHDSAYHRIRVTDNNGLRLLRFERNRQSSMYLDAPFETDFEYPNYLHITMAIAPKASRTLVIGLGGATVVKRMWRDYPWMHVDAVELDPEVVDVAREFFALPEDERIDVHVGDGRHFLRLAEHTYDIVIVDAFDDDHVPRTFITEEFCREARDHMTENGVIAYNFIGAVYGAHSRSFRSLYRTARNVWRNVWVFPIDFSQDVSDKSRNIVMLASDAELTPDQLMERIASRVDGLVTVPGFHQFGEDLYRGKIRSGDVPLLLDERPKRKRQ